MTENKSTTSHVDKIKAIRDSFAYGSGDIKPFFETTPGELHKLKIKKATNKSGTFRGHPRGGE